MANTLGTLLIDVKADTQQLIQGFNKAERAIDKTTKQMSYAVKGLIGAFVGLNTLDIAKNFTTQLDKITSANNKLKLVTKTTEEFTIAQKRLFEVAQITNQGYSETVSLYSKLSDSMLNMGKSQSDIFRTVETVNKAIALSGSSAEEASAAVLQLGQAFGSGLLQGDELKSINENAQGLSKAIAEGMGVAVGELKDLGSEGKITSEILAKALERVANSTDDKYKKMTKTIAQSMQVVSNSITRVVEQFDKMTGVSNVIADNIQGISKALESITPYQLEKAFDTFKVGAELIVASYVALKILKAGQEAYNIVSGISAEVEKKRTNAILLQTESLRAKELAELASMKTANSYNLVTKQADFQTQTQIKNTQALQSELLKQSVAIEKNVVKQAVMNDKLRDSVMSFNMASLRAGALSMVMSTIPFIAITTGIGLIANSLLNASKESTLFKESLQKTTEELKKLTEAQIEVRIIGGLEELKKAQQEVEKLKKDLEKLPRNIDPLKAGNVGGIGSIDVEKTNKKLSEQRSIIQANIDTAQEQVDKSRELLDLLNSIKGDKKTTVNIKTIIPKEDSSLINYLVNGEETIEKKVNITVTQSLEPLSDDVKKIIDPKGTIIEDYAKKFQNLTQSGKATAETIALITAEMNKDIDDLNKESNKKAKEAEKEKQRLAKETAEVEADFALVGLDSQKEKFIKLDNEYKADLIKYKDVLGAKEKLDSVYSDKRLELANTQTFEAEQKRLDIKQLEIEAIDDEFNKERELAKFKEESSLLQLQRQLQLKEITQNQYEQSKVYLDQILKKSLEQVDIDEKLKRDFDFKGTIELDIIGEDKSVQRISKSFEDLNEATKEYEKRKLKIGNVSELQAKNEETFRKDQMNGYINMAGALGSMFEAGSKEAASFQAAQLSLALVEGTRAVLSSGLGDPYTAIPRMAAMAIMVKSLLGNIGVAFGMNKSSTSSDAFSSQVANTGTGTILGDSKKASESITNALNTLEDFAQPQFQTLQSMNNYLKNIATSIGGVSSILVQNADYALGQGFTGFDTGFKNNIDSSSLLSPINSIISKIPVIGQVNGLFGGIINSVLGGVFGKTSVSQSLQDSGITFANQLLKNAIVSFEGSAYQTIATTVSKKSWFGSSSNTYLSTYFKGLDSGVENQFSLVLRNLYNTVQESGKALDLSSSSLNNSLNKFVVRIGKISLKGKTGEQIQELLTNVFGKIGDDLASATIPDLGGFQQVGEGLFATMTRVATGMEESKFYIDRLGTSTVKYTDIINKQGVVGFEALAQSIIKADEATYGLNNGVVQMIDNFDLTTEELYNTYLTFGNIRDILEATNQSASNLSSSMILGAGSISALDAGTKSYMENFLSESERLNIELDRLREEFKLAGYEMPKTRQGFIKLINSIDTSTEEGAKAYGRLITISDSYNDTISEIEDNLSTLIATFSNLGDSVAQTIATLAGADSDSQSATNQIKSFWEKRKEIDSLLALNGNLTETQQSRLSTLVGEVNSLATNIQGQSSVSSNITNELISNLTGLKDSLNLSEQILSVNIVGVASNVSLIENIAGVSATVPSLVNNTSNYVTSSELSTEIKDILTTIKDNIYNYPRKTFEILDNVVNGNQKVKVQS